MKWTSPNFFRISIFQQTTKNCIYPHLDNEIDLIIYIYVPPETCYDRIVKRDGIECQSDKLNINFLTKLEEYYYDWLNFKNSVIFIDGTENMEHILKKVTDFICEKTNINRFIKNNI